MGGSPLAEEVKRIISDAWYRKTSGGNKKDVPVKEIINDATDLLRQYKLFPPSKSSFYNVISSLNDLPEDKRAELDKLNKPWNLETLSLKDCDLNSDTIPFVLQLWRYSVNLGEVFTIRHAIWASRLSYVLNNLDIAEQWIHTLRYAREDELSFLSGTPIKIAQLNSLLVMGHWERMTLAETDVTFKANRRLENRVFTHYGRDRGIVEEYLHALLDVNKIILDAALDNKLSDKYERATEITSLIASLPSSSKCFPDFESRMVYLRHLAKLSSLPYWKTAEPKEIHKIITDLRSWIFEAMKNKNKSKALYQPGNNHIDLSKIKKTFKRQSESSKNKKVKFEEFSSISPPKPRKIPATYGSFPLDIYLAAGFDLNQDTDELEAELKKVHPEYWQPEGGK